MFRSRSHVSCALAAALILAGCGEPGGEAPAPPPADAAVAAALADPILTDPDLTSQNDAQAAVIVAGPVVAAFPPIDRSDAAVDFAREDAVRLVGRIGDPPSAASADLAPLRDSVTAAQLAAASGVVPAGCAARLTYTAVWAARLDDAFAPYPRGAVEEAAGVDGAGCRLRVIHYATPVPMNDVVAFHHAKLVRGGFRVAHEADGTGQALRGRSGAATYLIFIRKREDGLTAADIVVAGA